MQYAHRQTSQPTSSTSTTSTSIQNVPAENLARELNIETGKSIVFSVNYKTTPTGKEMMETAANAVKALYPEADILKKQSSDPNVICSIVLVSVGGDPFNYKIWQKEHTVERHFTDTNQSMAQEIQKAAKEAVKSADSLRGEGADKEYELYSRLLS